MPNQMIRDIAAGTRAPTGTDIAAIRAHIANAGFDPASSYLADRRVLGLPWSDGAAIEHGDRIPTAELHYLRHVVAQREWPPRTSPAEYVDSLRELADIPRTGILISEIPPFGWHVAIVGRSGRWQGPRGFEWMLVEYRVNSGHWATGFQVRDGLLFFISRRIKRWLRLPT